MFKESQDGLGSAVQGILNLNRLSGLEGLLFEPDAGQVREGSPLVIAFLQQRCVDPVGHGDGDPLGFSRAVVHTS